MKVAKVLITATLIGLVVVELILRWQGLHNVPLFREDLNYEYIQKSNQDVLIYRNRYFTNSLGMRSMPIDSAKKKILLIGDSILNGGNQVSHDNLASTLIEARLNKLYAPDSFQTLNISAGSWGPDNGMAFIKKHGHFNPRMICLVFNSHDAGDIMDFMKHIGIHPSRPVHNQPLAIIEFYKRVILPRVYSSPDNDLPEFSQKVTAEFNPGWSYFLALSRKLDIPLIVYLHASKEEMEKKAYDTQGQKIIKFCNENNLPLVKDIHIQKDEYLLDIIHLNSQGQKMIADLLFPAIEEQFKLHRLIVQK
ncbi:hypothetical protein [Telluribacter sp. SYSU D00476]|uniref:hypothetical protein n=1 Tax=Telluribacter sp. SYSU D00476 TaxID=2811430 RepID=UPI001FF194BF|nr:hypothetical protein [Telluribacter sp. SYSU D00476]